MGILLHCLDSIWLSIFPELSQRFDSLSLNSGEKILQSIIYSNVSKSEQFDSSGLADLVAAPNLGSTLSLCSWGPSQRKGTQREAYRTEGMCELGRRLLQSPDVTLEEFAVVLV